MCSGNLAAAADETPVREEKDGAFAPAGRADSATLDIPTLWGRQGRLGVLYGALQSPARALLRAPVVLGLTRIGNQWLTIVGPFPGHRCALRLLRFIKAAAA